MFLTFADGISLEYVAVREELLKDIFSPMHSLYHPVIFTVRHHSSPSSATYSGTTSTIDFKNHPTSDMWKLLNVYSLILICIMSTILGCIITELVSPYFIFFVTQRVHSVHYQVCVTVGNFHIT